MKFIKQVTTAAIVILFGATSAFSAAQSWNLDKAHSNVYFSVDHIFSKVNGHFNEFTTDIKFDPAELEGSKFDFEIKVSSIDTNIGKRDKHLQSPDFFDADGFPLMTFKSSKITDKGNGMYDVAGTLTIKDKDYDLTLPLKLEGVKEHPAQKGTDVAGFNGRITIDRLAHDVGSGKFYEMGVVDLLGRGGQPALGPKIVRPSHEQSDRACHARGGKGGAIHLYIGVVLAERPNSLAIGADVRFAHLAEAPIPKAAR